MKDIKSLYLTAKASGNTKDISAYSECVHELLESKPNEYISNLEYIISSSIGLKTWNEFIEKYGLSIAAYDGVIACFEKCISKCEKSNKDDSEYKKEKEKLESFHEKYNNCFMMYEYFNEDINENYVETYYGFTDKNGSQIQNNKLLSGMIKKFGEAAIPDMLITADKMGDSTITQTLKFLESYSNDPVYYQWIHEAANDITINDGPSMDYLKEMHSKDLGSIIELMRNRHMTEYREAAIMGDNDSYIAYTEKELNAIQDMISLYEYKLTFLENTDEILDLQNKIYSLYEEFDGLVNEDGSICEDVADSIIPMLPTATGGGSKSAEFDEAQWMVNTRNKKTGEIPGYLSRNHDLGYGEEDDDKPKKKNDEEDHTLDDYKRKSVEENEPDNSNTDDSILDGIDNDKDDKKDSSLSDDDKRAINNYYYYTYNNSLNKNANSFNKSNHTSDNHSTSTFNTDDHSVNKGDGNRTNDDHSTSKGNNRDNTKNATNSYNGESAVNPWELDVFSHPKPFEEKSKTITEEVGDADDNKPVSDHPIKDTLTDIDRALVKKQQSVKKAVQNVQNAGRAFIKPAQRTMQWLNKMAIDWKDNDENKIKERMADPHARNNLFTAIGTAIKAGSLLKAGLLLNPVFLFLSITKGIGKNKKEFRIRNEMIGELKTEIEIIDAKINDAANAGDNKAKYQLMRLKNELNKKLIRVGGTKEMRKIL